MGVLWHCFTHIKNPKVGHKTSAWRPVLLSACHTRDATWKAAWPKVAWDKESKGKPSAANQKRTIHGLDLDIFGQKSLPESIFTDDFTQKNQWSQFQPPTGSLRNRSAAWRHGQHCAGRGRWKLPQWSGTLRPSGKVTVCELENHHL